jgi:transcriptional regulator with XRE-family HTH domain
MRRFDRPALFAALDQQRVRRSLTWSQVARDTGVSIATIRRTKHGGRMEVDGMLALVNWLGVPVETFVRDPSGNRSPPTG